LAVNFGWDAAASRYRGTASADPFFVEWVANPAFSTEVRLTMDKTGSRSSTPKAASGVPHFSHRHVAQLPPPEDRIESRSKASLPSW
jgi:hypothetical protein